jgi:hypothetical protein
MADAALHPQATHNLPFFVTAPGETDVLMVVTALFLFGAVVAFGVFYFRLHSLPEHVAHKADKVQMEIVSILCLIALFTHMHIFWIAGLLLAFIDIPDFGTPLRRIAGSIDRMVEAGPRADARETAADIGRRAQDGEPPVEAKRAKQGDGAAASPRKPAAAAATQKERSHA